MPHSLRRALRVALATAVLIPCGCASINHPTPTPATNIVGVAVPEVIVNRPWGIPDWVRVIHADPFVVDRKKFGPGDVVPVSVKLKQDSAGELFAISYSTDSTITPAASLFDIIPNLYLTDAAVPTSFFSFALRVKSAASLPATPTKVTIYVTGVENAQAHRVASNEFIVAR